MAPPAKALNEKFEEGCIRIHGLPYLGKLEGLDELIARVLPWSPRAYWPLWFLGSYSAGKAHIDLGPHVVN